MEAYNQNPLFPMADTWYANQIAVTRDRIIGSSSSLYRASRDVDHIVANLNQTVSLHHHNRLDLRSSILAISLFRMPRSTP